MEAFFNHVIFEAHVNNNLKRQEANIPYNLLMDILFKEYYFQIM